MPTVHLQAEDEDDGVAAGHDVKGGEYCAKLGMCAMSSVSAVRGCQVGGKMEVDREFILMIYLAATGRIKPALSDKPALGQCAQDRQLQGSIAGACLCMSYMMQCVQIAGGKAPRLQEEGHRKKRFRATQPQRQW